MDIQYGLDYCKRVGYYYWAKSPGENRHVVTVDDWSQDLAVHLLDKITAYDHSRPWKKWVHTIVVNKAITLLTKQWDLKHGLGFSSSVKSLVYINIEGEVELVTSITPELECIIYQSIIKKVKRKKEDHQMDVTHVRVEELCEQFSSEARPVLFDGETDETALASLVGVLSFTLNEMTDDDFQALSEADRLELAKLGEAVEKNKITMKKATPKTGGGGAGTGGSKGRGIIKRIHELFAEGTQTVSEIVAVMDREGVVFSPATVRTQVGVLRRKAGLTRQPKAEEPVSAKDVAAEAKKKADDDAKKKADADAKKKADAKAKPTFKQKPKTAAKGKGKGKK